jgi:hypothetical protein
MCLADSTEPRDSTLRLRVEVDCLPGQGVKAEMVIPSEQFPRSLPDSQG